MGNRSSFTLKGVRREITKMVRHDHATGHTIRSEPDGYETADIEVIVDLEAIANVLGRKAMKNRNSRASSLHGLVKVYASNKKRIPL